jgi:hypothetical protein
VKDYEPQTGSRVETRSGHEVERVQATGLLTFAAGLIALLIGVQVILSLVMGAFSRREARIRDSAPPRFQDNGGAFPAPRLQADPAIELARIKEYELARLSSYGWVDEKKEIAHIPIDRAMEIVSEQNRTAPAPEAASRAARGGPLPEPPPKPQAHAGAKQEHTP